MATRAQPPLDAAIAWPTHQGSAQTLVAGPSRAWCLRLEHPRRTPNCGHGQRRPQVKLVGFDQASFVVPYLRCRSREQVRCASASVLRVATNNIEPGSGTAVMALSRT